MERDIFDVPQFLLDNPVVKVCAPMVRYSKLEFRSLVRKYGCQLCYTPMIMANCFIQSSAARDVEFSTNEGDTPLIVQFASKSVDEFVLASEMVSPYCDGVDLNCGCPQKWAMKDGYGADLLTKPYLVHDMVRQLKNRVSNRFSVSIKIRIKEDLRKTIELCRMAEAAGASLLTVHGRTPKQRNDPINVDAIKEVVNSLRIPVIANGDIKSLEECEIIREKTGCHGAMVAGALLQNPGVFSGHRVTPMSCVTDWISTCLSSNPHFMTFHHHLVFMLEKVMHRRFNAEFNSLVTVESVIHFLQEHIDLPQIPVSVFSKSNLTYEPSLPPGSYFMKHKENQFLPMEDYLDGSFFLFEQ